MAGRFEPVTLEHPLAEREIDDLRASWEADRTPELTLELAAEYRRGAEPAKALEVLESGLENHPGDAATRVEKGRCHLELDQPAEAKRELTAVVVDDPAHLGANQLLARAHARLGELERARDRLDLAVLLGGEAIDLENLTAPAGAPGPVAEPVTPSADPDPFVLLDWIEFDEARYAAALFGGDVFAVSRGESAAAAPAQSPVPTLTLGELYRRQGHHDEAAGIFRQILERQPGNVEAARALAEMNKAESWPLSAEDLLGGAPELESGGSRGELLRRYRDRLLGRD